MAKYAVWLEHGTPVASKITAESDTFYTTEIRFIDKRHVRSIVDAESAEIIRESAKISWLKRLKAMREAQQNYRAETKQILEFAKMKGE